MSCIEHTQMPGKHKYGGKRVGGYNIGLHVYTYCIKEGIDPLSLRGTGTVVRHTCDNKRCINPAHLVAGSISDNVRDAMRSELVYKASYPIAKEMRRLKAIGWTRKEIQDKFKLSSAQTLRILANEAWVE